MYLVEYNRVIIVLFCEDDLGRMMHQGYCLQIHDQKPESATLKIEKFVETFGKVTPNEIKDTWPPRKLHLVDVCAFLRRLPS